MHYSDHTSSYKDPEALCTLRKWDAAGTLYPIQKLCSTLPHLLPVIAALPQVVRPRSYHPQLAHLTNSKDFSLIYTNLTLEEIYRLPEFWESYITNYPGMKPLLLILQGNPEYIKKL